MPEHVSVHEVWGHEFMLETCCEHLHQQLVTEMNADPDWSRCFLRALEIEALCGHRLRRIADNSGGMLLDWQLRIGAGLGRAQTRAFIARHHAHCAPPVMWRFDAAIYNGNTLLGLAIVGNPVAPGLMLRGILEVNRLCLRRDLPDALRWNAASMLYGWCAREARRRGWRKIITYTRADEPGTSLRAAGLGPGGEGARPRLARRQTGAVQHECLDRQGPVGEDAPLRLPPRAVPRQRKKGGLRRRPPSLGRKRPAARIEPRAPRFYQTAPSRGFAFDATHHFVTDATGGSSLPRRGLAAARVRRCAPARLCRLRPCPGQSGAGRGRGDPS